MIDSFTGEYRFLSNFYPSEITFEGIVYPTVEHAYQALKSLDIPTRKRISRMATPRDAKQAGRLVYLRPQWDEIKVAVMHDLIRLKFAIPELRKKLLDTGTQWLVEGNNWGDRYWGEVNGQGHNYLGKVLMVVRKELRNAGSDS